MTRTILFAAAGALMATSASAAPLFNQGNSVEPTMTENVRLVCDDSGRCYRTRGRRYVERRYYGDSYTYGRRAYVQPGYGYAQPGYGYAQPGYGYGGGYYGGGPSIGFSFGTGRY